MGSTCVLHIWFQPPHRGSGPANGRRGQYCRLGHCCHGCLLPTRTGGLRLWCKVLTPLGHPTAGRSWLGRLPAGAWTGDRQPLSLLTASAERDDAQHGSRPGAGPERAGTLNRPIGKLSFGGDRLVAAGSDLLLGGSARLASLQSLSWKSGGSVGSVLPAEAGFPAVLLANRSRRELRCN